MAAELRFPQKPLSVQNTHEHEWAGRWAWPPGDMGGGSSKQAQLERYGQLLSPAERRALETTFHEIAGAADATSFTDKQFSVSSRE